METLDPQSIFAFTSPVASALLIWVIQRRFLKFERNREEQVRVAAEAKLQIEMEACRQEELKIEARKEETRLTLTMLKAIGELSYANSVAIKLGEVNGTMEAALTSYRRASLELSTFMEDQAIERIGH